MDPGTLNLTLYRGAGFREHMESYGPNSTPDNFTGYGAEIVFLKKDKTTLLHLTSADGAVVFPALPAGSIDIVLSAEQTTAMPEGAVDYYLNLLPPEGHPIRFLMGRAVFV